MKNQNNIDILYFGGEDWWYHSRAHIDIQLMRRFAKNNTSLYVNSIVMQKPNLREGGRFAKRLLRKMKSLLTGLKKSDAGFWVYSPVTFPVHHLAWARPLNRKILEYQIRFTIFRLGMKNPIVLVACPAACEVAMNIKKTCLVYQRTDRFEAYPNANTEVISQYDRKLKANADLTIFVSHTLYDEEAVQCKKTLFLDHGVDYEMFATAESRKDKPDDIQGIKRPIIGFFGDIEDHILDSELLETVAELLPEMNFVFVGEKVADWSRLVSKNNVWMLGHKPYEQIPHYGKCFDVAIMPWRRNDWTEAINPIKLKEYLALGKPIVSTPFPELDKYLDVSYKAATAEEFAQCIKRALAEDGPERIAARRKRVQPFTWDSKAQIVLDQLFGANASV